MTFTREQKQEAYKKLPSEVQDFIMSNETTEISDDILKKSGLSEDQAILANSEILYVLLGLKQKSTLSDILIKNGIDKEKVELIKKEVEWKVFSELDKIKNNSQTKSPLNQAMPISANKPVAPITPPKPEIKNNIGDSFEQTILSQAKAMQIAQPAFTSPASPELQRGEPKPPSEGGLSSSMAKPAQTPPVNLPGAEVVKEVPMVPKTPESSKPNIAVPNYTGGQDPYREPAI